MEAIEAKMDALYLIKEMLTNQQYIDMCETVQKEYFAETDDLDDLDDPPDSPNNFTDDPNYPNAITVIQYKAINNGRFYLVEEENSNMVYDIDGNELEGYKFRFRRFGCSSKKRFDGDDELFIWDENNVTVDEVERA